MIFTVDQTVEAGNRENEVKLKMPDNNHKCNSQKPKSILAKIHMYFKEYCNSTSIHGFKYFAESRSLCERLLWLILVLFSISACVYLIVQTYVKFQQSPVIVSFATTNTPIYTIPFPAVTICPLSKARSSLFNFTDVMAKIKRAKQISDKEKRYAKYMSLLCGRGSPFFKEESTFTEDFFSGIDEFKIPQREFMLSCVFLDSQESCQKLFHPIIADQGICYTFNMLDRKYIYNENVVLDKKYHFLNQSTLGWTVDKGYQTDRKGRDSNYPYRALLSGAENALQITMFQNVSNIDHYCVKDVQGFNVLIHPPHTLPRLKKQFFTVGFKQSVMASVRPNEMTTSDQVLQFDSSIRKCYFSTEKKLKYFKVYTPGNCELECLTEYTLKRCGCVSYYMPREEGTLLCGNANASCMGKAEYSLKRKQSLEVEREEENGHYSCDCKPLCSDVTYNTEISGSYWDLEDQIQAWFSNFNMPRDKWSQYAKLTIFFEQDSFLTSERNELYSPIDFLANFGGLLGLFTGFSLLSAAEIIYFLTLRMCCNFRLYRSLFGQKTDNIA
ncbi:unnamed protein product [Psylliodes chrysocephalus]|uniref:Uncharacterized protein n=1 Tax=Psylliodes chrysocephalus TaxID=3402493 RepID=A0A9P0G5H1_9CUCU|nr:unnamed protein product [Psylliodes chrysocephala]